VDKVQISARQSDIEPPGQALVQALVQIGLDLDRPRSHILENMWIDLA
jgi:hypothetical protein